MSHDHDIFSGFAGARVLITGGLGFIGSNLARRLVALGSRVTVVDSLIPEYGGNLHNVHDMADRLDINISDVRDEHAFGYLVRGQDFLFNLAGQTSHIDSMREPFADLEINARAQLSILERCRHDNPSIRVVFASTRQIYGKPERLPVDESHPLRPVDVNGINKLAGEGYHQLYSRVHGVRASVLRMTNTYGPGMRVKDARQTFLGIWIKRLLDGEPLIVFGDGEQIRDFNYVDDAVDALLRAAVNDRAYGEIYNLGHDPVSLNQLAAAMCELGGGCFQHRAFPAGRRAIDIGDYHADYGKAARELGWTPQVSLEAGLARTIAYYREHGAHYWDREESQHAA